MTLTYQLIAEPEAKEALRSLRADHPEVYGRVRPVLARLREDPGTVRADKNTQGFTNGLFAYAFEGPEERRWLIVWDLVAPYVVSIPYVGPAPGEAPLNAPAYTTASDVVPQQQTRP